MAAEIFSIIGAAFSLVLFCLFGGTVLYISKNQKFKLANSSFVVASAVFAITSLVLLILKKYVDYEDMNELVMNFEFVFILLDLVMLWLYLNWFNSKTKDREFKRTNYVEWICENAFNIVNLIIVLTVLIAFIIFSVGGDIYGYGSPADIANNVHTKMNNLKRAFLAMSVILWILLVSTIVSKVWLRISKKSESNLMVSIVKGAALAIGYACSAIAMLLMYLTLRNIDNPKNWFTREFIDFFTNNYSNALSYIILYLLIGSLVSTLIWYVPSNFEVKNYSNMIKSYLKRMQIWRKY